MNKKEVPGEKVGGLSTAREGGGPRANEDTYPAGKGFRRGVTPGMKGRPGRSGGGKGPP